MVQCCSCSQCALTQTGDQTTGLLGGGEEKLETRGRKDDAYRGVNNTVKSVC